MTPARAVRERVASHLTRSYRTIFEALSAPVWYFDPEWSGCPSCRSRTTKIVLPEFVLSFEFSRQCSGSLVGNLLTDFPVVPVGIGNATYSPSVFLGHGPDRASSGVHRARESRVRIGNDHHKPTGAAAKGFRAEVMVLG